MNKKNGGYSLVELIIVIAIMAVLTGVAIIGINSVSGMKAKSCAEQILSYMNETKTNALGFDGSKLKLYRESDSTKVDVGTYVYSYSIDPGTGKEVRSLTALSSSTNVVGEKVVNVKVKLTDGNEYDLETYDVYVGFNRSSGAFTPVEVNQGATVVYSSADKKYIEEIKVTQNANTYTIKCVHQTGKFGID